MSKSSISVSEETHPAIADDILISPPKRINWSTISGQILAVLNIEKGIFYTLIELTFRPGKAVRKHLLENRKLLLNPTRFLVLSTTLAAFITFYYIDIEGFSNGFKEGFEIGMDESMDSNTLNSHDNPAKERFKLIFMERLGIVYKQMANFGYFFLVPAGAFVTWFFCRKRYNYPELVVVHCYLWSMVNCFTIVLTPLTAGSMAGYSSLMLISFIYPIYFYTKFMKHIRFRVFKAFILTFLSGFLLMVFAVIVTVYNLYDIKTIIAPNSVQF